MLRLLPLAAFAVFVVVDAAANWRLIQSRTLSEWVWAGGWPTRLLAGVLLPVLFGHLVFQWPDGPR